MSIDKESHTDIKRHREVSYTSSLSDDGSLYPGDEHDPLLTSIQSHGSLWRQYSLIQKSDERKNKPADVCFCCEGELVRHGTLKTIFLLVVALGLISSCLALRFSVFAEQSVVLTGGDQSLLPISTYFNQNIKVVQNCSEDGTSKLFILPELPKISTDRLVYHEGTKFLMPSWSYQYWGLNLLKGTEVTISICTDLHLQFYILKSEQKLKDWKQTTLFNDYDFQGNIRPQKSCDDKQYLKSHLIQVSDSDIYYILFSSSVGWRFFTEVTLILRFNRTVYDTSNYRTTCLLSDKSCTGNLSYASKDIALIQTSVNMTNPSNSFKTFKVTYQPIPRWSFYLKLFGYLYLAVVAVTILYTLWRCCVAIRQVPQPVGEKEPLLRRLKRYSYSMKSTAGEEPWLVVRQSDQYDDDKEIDVVERDSQSVLEGSIERRPPYHRRRDTTQSNYSNNSDYSLYVSSDQQRRDMLRNMQLMEEQQLLDSVMTSAGVSAI